MSKSAKDPEDVGVPINQDVMVNTLNSYGVTDMTDLLLKEPSQQGIIGLVVNCI